MSMLGTLLNPFGNGNNSTSANTSSTSTETNYADSRMVNDGGSLGISGTGNALTFDTNTTSVITATDSGAVAAGMQGFNAAANLAGSAFGAAGNLAGSAFGTAGNLAATALESNANNVDHLLSTAEYLFAGQQKALDISASLAGLLAAKATGTPDAGLQTAAGTSAKTWAVAAVAVAVIFALARHR